MMPMEPLPAEREPSSGIMHAFAHALERWTETGGFSVDSHLPLLATYEAICDREIAALEAQILQPSGSATLAASLRSECALLRGERSSWRLLRVLYADYDARQQPPPELPPPPTDWGAELRALGPPPPKLGESEIASRQEDSEAAGGFSRLPADAGLSVRPLHDEAVLEARFAASDVLLDLGQRLKGWLEHAAAERVRTSEVNASMSRTGIRLRYALGEKADFISKELNVSPDVAGLAQAARQLGLAATDASAAELASLLVAKLGASAEVGEAARGLPPPPSSPTRPSSRVGGSTQRTRPPTQTCFARSGSLCGLARCARAMQLCRRCHQHWRAATLAGGEAWHYDVQGREWRGNPERATWRLACDAIAQRAARHPELGGAKHEAALYGALAASESSLPLVLAACGGWEDTLWAHLNTALSSHVAALTRYYAEMGSGSQAAAAGEAGDAEEGSAAGRGDAASRLVRPALHLPRAVLETAFDAAVAGAEQSTEPPSARHHHDLQRRIFELRLAQLPVSEASEASSSSSSSAAASAVRRRYRWASLPPLTTTASVWVFTSAAAAATPPRRRARSSSSSSSRQ